MRLGLRVLIGTLLGLFGGAMTLTLPGVASGGRTLVGVLVFGAVFGGTLALFVDRYGVPLDEPLAPGSTPRGLGRVAAAGAMAAGVTSGLAYVLAFLPSPWYVLGCVVLGALVTVCHWAYANIKWP
jgi:hypothetical protein